MDAFQRAKSTRSADLHAALRQTNIANHIMFGGSITFDAKGQNNNIGGPMIQIQNQEPVVIAPSDIAQARPVLPMTRWSARG